MEPQVPESMHPAPYRAMGRVCTAEVRARARAEVGIVTLRLVDPFPAQILPEVDVEGADTAVLLQVAVVKTRTGYQQKGRLTTKEASRVFSCFPLEYFCHHRR